MSKNVKCVMAVPFKIICMASVGKSYMLHENPSQFLQSCIQQGLSQRSLYPAQLQLLCFPDVWHLPSPAPHQTALLLFKRHGSPRSTAITVHEFPEGGSLHKGKDGLCSIIRCRFWVCRVEHLKLKSPGPCATCRAVTSLHKVHTKQESPGIKSNHAACTPPIKENENMRCA